MNRILHTTLSRLSDLAMRGLPRFERKWEEEGKEAAEVEVTGSEVVWPERWRRCRASWPSRPCEIITLPLLPHRAHS